MPPGLQPVLAWCADAPRDLQVCGDAVSWLTGGGDAPTYRWHLSLADGGVRPAAGTLLMAGDPPEITAPDGTTVPNPEYNNIDASLTVDGQFYYQHDDKLRVRARDGADLPFAHWAAEPRTFRQVQVLRAVASRIYVVGKEMTSKDAHLAVVAFDRQGAQVQTFRSAPVSRWGRCTIDTCGNALVVVIDDRGYVITPTGVIALPRRPSELLGWAPAGATGVGWTKDALVAYEPTTGRIGRPLVEALNGAPQRVVVVGDWYYVHVAGEQHDELLAVRADGRDVQLVLAIDAELSDLCTDGAALYWLDADSGAVGRAPLGPGGAPLPVEVGDLPRFTGALSIPVDERPAPLGPAALPGPDDLAALHHAIACGATDTSSETPWWGWLFLSLARYQQVHNTLALAVSGRAWTEGDHDLDGALGLRCSVRGDWLHVASTPLRTNIAVKTVRDGEDLHVDPVPLFASQYTGFAAWVAQRAAHTPPTAIEARLWRWLPGRDLIAAAVKAVVVAAGGTVDDTGWLRIPPALATLADRLDASPRDLAALATLVGDAEIAWPTSLTRRRAVVRAHRVLLDGMIESGAEAIVEALPALYAGRALTDACDRFLASRGLGTLAFAAVLRVLQAHPAAPPSEVVRALIARVTARGDNRLFAVCAQYIIERGIDPARARAALRLAAGVGVVASPGAPPGLATPYLIVPALVVDPAVGIHGLRRMLCDTSDWEQCRAIGMLVMIGAPWCVRELRLARSGATDSGRARIDDALAVLAAPSRGEATDPMLRSEMNHWHIALDELPPEHRSALWEAGVRSRRASLALVPPAE